MTFRKNMRKRCLLHIGMHKTGSTSIQNALSTSLTDRRFHYLDIGTPNHSQAFSSLFKKNPYAYHGNQAIGWGTHDVDRYREDVGKKIIESFSGCASGVTEIISGEDIGYLDYDETVALRDFLLNYFETIVVVAYIRSPRSYLNSAVQELIKHHLNNFDFSDADPNYNRFKMLPDIFGDKNVVYRSYDKILSCNRSVLSDFCTVFYIKLGEIAISTVENKSLSLEALSVLYLYQKHSFRHQNEKFILTRDALINSLSSFGGKKFVLGERIIMPFIERNKDGISFLENTLGCHLEPQGSFNENSEPIINDEKDMISYAVSQFDCLNDLLLRHGVSSGMSEQSQPGIAKLMRLLDCHINGDRLDSDFYLK